MENQRHSKVPNLKSSGDVISPINVLNFVRGRFSPLSPIFDPYASDRSDSPSPLMNYLCSAAPALAATVQSSPVFATPLKVEEDVLVMDGIPVPKSNKGGRERVKATMTSLNLNSTSSQKGGVGAENSNSNKADICRHWEDSGICRYGSKCQFAHGKEELRPPRFPGKNKLKFQWIKLIITWQEKLFSQPNHRRLRPRSPLSADAAHTNRLIYIYSRYQHQFWIHQ